MARRPAALHPKKKKNNEPVDTATHSGENQEHTEHIDQAPQSNTEAKNEEQKPGSGQLTITIGNYNFQPANVTVPQGTKVTWVNKTTTTHTSTSGTGCSGDGKWNSGNLGEGASYSYTFGEEGTYNYFCIPHCSMGMVGVVNVKSGAVVPAGTASADETQQPVKRKKGPVSGFKSLDIINSPCTYTLGKGVLDFSIYHRFDDISGPNGGDQVLFGLDNMRDVRIALAYGITKYITIGIARSKGDWFNTPYQVIKNLYDGSVRINLLRQDTCKKPVSITVFGNTVFSDMDRQPGTGTEADFHHQSDRYSHSGQLMISRDFRKHLTIQVMGTYVRRNWVNCCAGSKDDLDMYAVGAGGRWALTQKLALIGEYYYVFSGYHEDHRDLFFNPLAVGLEINTGMHVFHLNFSNSTGLIPNTYLPYTTASWRNNGVRFGFSISRKFNMYNIKRK